MRGRLPLVLILFAGCGPGDEVASTIEVLDSAGILTVRHSEHNDLKTRVPGNPEVVVGRGEPELFRVRGGAFLAGGFVIANAGSDELLFFSEEGDLARRVGGEGEGPEEFQNILWVQADNSGGVIAYDAGNLRLNWYGSDGTFLRSVPVRHEPEEPASEASMVGRGFPLGVVPADRLVTVPWPAVELDGVEGPAPLRGELRSYSLDLSEYVAIDTVQLRVWYEAPQPEGPPVDQILESPLFLSSAHGRWLAYSEAEAHRIVVLQNGGPAYVVVENRRRVPFEPDSVPSHVNHVADSLPSYRQLKVDADGRIWVRPIAELAETHVRWRVFSSNAREVEAVQLPASTLVLDARGERLLLLERDDFDVETVTVRLAR